MFLALWATTILQPAKKLLKWQQDILDQLEQFRSLEQEWDSYSGSPISSESIAMAQALLFAIWDAFADTAPDVIRPFAVVPLPYGGVQIEWRGRAGAIEVEIDLDGNLSYLLELGSGDHLTVEQNANASVDEVASAFPRINTP